MPVLVGAILLHQPTVRRTTRKAIEQTALLSSHMVEDISGAETVKAFGAERRRSEKGESFWWPR